MNGPYQIMAYRGLGCDDITQVVFAVEQADHTIVCVGPTGDRASPLAPQPKAYVASLISAYNFMEPERTPTVAKTVGELAVLAARVAAGQGI